MNRSPKNCILTIILLPIFLSITFAQNSNIIDSLLSNKKSREIEIKNSKFNYEPDKKDKQIQVLKYENSIQTIKIAHQKKLHAIYLSGLIFAFITITIILIQLRKKNIAYEFLVKKNLGLFNKEDDLKSIKEQITSNDLNGIKKSIIADDKKEEIRNNLIFLLEEEKIFKDFDLSIVQLAKRLSTNRTYLSKIINDEFGKNYSNFINEYRVKEAIALFSDPQKCLTFSIAGIAKESGFRSVSKFIPAFKKCTGVTPCVFRRNVIVLNNR